jgi:GntR family transcriptional repressor for pyruvate dehydrogenase complex
LPIGGPSRGGNHCQSLGAPQRPPTRGVTVRVALNARPLPMSLYHLVSLPQVGPPLETDSELRAGGRTGGRAESPTSVSDYLTRQLLELMRAQSMAAGDRLPSVRALDTRFGVAPPTIREALRRLQALGVVAIRHGSGIYVQNPHPRVVVANPELGRLDGRTILDLLDARLLIEPRLAELAAADRTADDLALLKDTLARAGENLAGKDPVLHHLNLGFHTAVAKVAGNRVLAQIIDSLLDLYSEEQMAIQRLYDDRLRDHRWHLQILAAIEGRRTALAAERMRQHVAEVRRVMEARLSGPEA